MNRKEEGGGKGLPQWRYMGEGRGQINKNIIGELVGKNIYVIEV